MPVLRFCCYFVFAALVSTTLSGQEWVNKTVGQQNPAEISAGIGLDPDGLRFFVGVFTIEDQNPAVDGNELVHYSYPEGEPELAVRTTVSTGGWHYGLSKKISYQPGGTLALSSVIKDDQIMVLQSTDEGFHWEPRVLPFGNTFGETELGWGAFGPFLMAYNWELTCMAFFGMNLTTQQWTHLKNLQTAPVFGAIYSGVRITMDIDERKDDLVLGYSEISQGNAVYNIARYTMPGLTLNGTPTRVTGLNFRKDHPTEVALARADNDSIAGITSDIGERYKFFEVRLSETPARVTVQDFGPAYTRGLGRTGIISGGDKTYYTITTSPPDINVRQVILDPTGIQVRNLPTIRNAHPADADTPLPFAMSMFGMRESRRLNVHYSGYSLDVATFTGCVNGRNRFCSTGDRFDVSVTWRDPQGNTGSGRAVPLTSDTGYFWFFNEANIELVIKVLNACTINQRHWVFAGGLTNVEATITVRDKMTGSVKTYHNNQGTAFQPVQDTSAFAGCTATKFASIDDQEDVVSQIETLQDSINFPPDLISKFPQSLQTQAGNCTPTDTRLCVNGGRFQVEADWVTGTGASGKGHAVKLTDDSGYFWFFNPENVELLTKVLNACNPFGRHWVFAAGLTNVRVVLKVTDTQTGNVKFYENSQGTAYQPIQDTNAFSVCP